MGVVQAEELKQMSSSIKEELQSLRSDSMLLTQQLKTALEDLKVSKKQQEQLKAASSALSTSLNSMTEKYGALLTQFSELEAKYSRAKRWIIRLAIAAVIELVVIVGTVIVMVKL